MTYLTELIKINRISDEMEPDQNDQITQDADINQIDLDGVDEVDHQMDDIDLDGDGEDIDSIVSGATDDPNKQGVIRTVPGARLVFKKDTGDGFEELWIYNIGEIKDDFELRKAILAGTDIEYPSKTSEDGTQQYTTWAAGNAELLHITGLPN